MEPEDFTGLAERLPEPLRLLVKDETVSTNDDARALGVAGAADGLVVVARRQTGGRGRRGAAWFSPPGESLAFSVLVRPVEPPALWPRLALAAGLAVAQAVEEFVPLGGIKWPNDVWIGGRKVAGILVEAGHGFAIIGIGINVNAREFPAGLAGTATSLALETGMRIGLPGVLGDILRQLARRRLQIGAEFHEVLEGVRQRCVLAGRAVSLVTASGRLEGTVEGIAPGGELLLRTATGVQRLLQADEVRLV